MKTPYYRVSTKKYRENCEAIEEPFNKLWKKNVIFAYSVKTNHDASIIDYAYRRGWYVEVVSEYEYNYAQLLGIPKDRIICNGPVKGSMLIQALKRHQILNLDSMDEVDTICKFLESNRKITYGKKYSVGLRINFDLESVCPGETTAGDLPSRFGINYENGDLKKAIEKLRVAGVEIAGFHMHSSTTTRSVNIFSKICEQVCVIARTYDLCLQYIDIGGGFFGGQLVEGKPTMEEYAYCICNILKNQFNPMETRLILEPGASIVATIAEYVTVVSSVKAVKGERVVTLDGTILHINPFMKNRPYDFRVIARSSTIVDKQHICGSTCMENDRFQILDGFSELKIGDIVVYSNVGAYTMSFNCEFILDRPEVIWEE